MSKYVTINRKGQITHEDTSRRGALASATKSGDRVFFVCGRRETLIAENPGMDSGALNIYT